MDTVEVRARGDVLRPPGRLGARVQRVAGARHRVLHDVVPWLPG